MFSNLTIEECRVLSAMLLRNAKRLTRHYLYLDGLYWSDADYPRKILEEATRFAEVRDDIMEVFREVDTTLIDSLFTEAEMQGFLV